MIIMRADGKRGDEGPESYFEENNNNNKAIVDIRLRPRCAIASLTVYTF